MNPILIILALMFTVGAALWLDRKRKLSVYSNRICQGRRWKEAFPAATKEEIRDFLESFRESFMLPKNLKLHFSPQDKASDIYKRASGFTDAMEFVEFFMSLEERFGKSVAEDMDDNWTLGDIFQFVTQKSDPDGGINSGSRRSPA